MTFSTTRLFPLLVLLALALLTFWLERTTRVEDRHPSLRRHDPDFIVDRFTVTNFGLNGRPESVLSAQKMMHYPDDDSTDLVAPRLVQTRANQPTFTVSADRGTLAFNGEEIFLYDNVVALRDDDERGRHLRFTTSFLHVVRDRALARTDRPVEITEGGSTLRGVGMEYRNDTRELTLHGRVQGVYQGVERRTR